MHAIEQPLGLCELISKHENWGEIRLMDMLSPIFVYFRWKQEETEHEDKKFYRRES